MTTQPQPQPRRDRHPLPDAGLADRLARRGLLAAAGGLLLAAAPLSTLAGPSGTGGVGAGTAYEAASRRSRLTRGTTLVHADLHNHTLLSDGDGDPAEAFASMRAAGLDAAALTDHATLTASLQQAVRAQALPPAYREIRGMTPEAWEATRRLADAADEPGAFTALRGFEWTEPELGHVNVWFSEEYAEVVEVGTVGPLQDWLLSEGGAGGLAGFNHPGRERGRFEEFRFEPRLRDRVVSMEIFNRREDYLFEGYDDGLRSPLCACLDTGWRTGLSGVSDEHGDDWGHPEGKGRTGLWVTEHSRAGVREALASRRFFATRTAGLRLDATADVVGLDRPAARMGGELPAGRGTVRFSVDLDVGPSWHGRPLLLQVLRPGPDVPDVVDVVPFEAGALVHSEVSLDAADGDWVLLRVSDPAEPNDQPGPAGHPCNDRALAYASPFWLSSG